MPTFHPFQRLPAEVRLIVWNFCTPPLRLIKRVQQGPHVKWHVFPRVARVPAVLHTCHESRTCWLASYHTVNTASDNTAPLFVNYNRDIFLVPSLSIATDQFDPFQLTRIKNIAWNYKWLQSYTQLNACLQSLPALQSFSMVVWPSEAVQANHHWIKLEGAQARHGTLRISYLVLRSASCR